MGGGEETSVDFKSTREGPNYQMKSMTENFRSVMSARNKELSEQREKKNRSHNIHGKGENKQKQDILFVNKILQFILMKILYQNRLYVSDAQRIIKGFNLIKIALHSGQDKEKIINNLRNLKDITANKDISVIEDIICETND